MLLLFTIQLWYIFDKTFLLFLLWYTAPLNFIEGMSYFSLQVLLYHVKVPYTFLMLATQSLSLLHLQVPNHNPKN